MFLACYLPLDSTNQFDAPTIETAYTRDRTRVLLSQILGRSGENGMLYIEHFRIKSCYQISLSLMLASAMLMFCTPDVFCSVEKYYYYLHISSFRLKKRAVKDVERIRNQGYNAIASRERVSDRGYWYRVYIGPFSSLQEAKLKREELRRKKLAEYVAIHKEKSLISAELAERKVPVEVEKPTPEISPPRDVAPVVPEKPAEAPSAPEKPAETKEVPAPTPSVEKREELERPLPLPPPMPPRKIKAKPARKALDFAPKGSGRNMGRGDFALGIRHTYREVESELTKRITSDGTTTIVEDISIAGVEKDDFPTRLHMDSLRIRFGLTDYVEGFAEIGGAYREFSDVGFVYGGGLRVNLFEVKGGRFRGFYGGLQGEYLAGGVEYEYSSPSGNKWEKQADWQEFVAKGELGVLRSWFATYVGVAYFHYGEDTERRLLENLPASLALYVRKDELKEESLEVFGGIDINLTSSVLVNVEGQVGDGKGIFGTLEYHF